MILISILAGSKSDEGVYQKAVDVLDKEGIPFELKILSAHRNPIELDEYVKNSKANVFICVAGLSAALPGPTAKSWITSRKMPINSSEILTKQGSTLTSRAF